MNTYVVAMNCYDLDTPYLDSVSRRCNSKEEAFTLMLRCAIDEVEELMIPSENGYELECAYFPSFSEGTIVIYKVTRGCSEPEKLTEYFVVEESAYLAKLKLEEK